MLIESLVRMGRPYLKVPQPAAEGIRQITDVDRPDACNFWRHVFLVEIDAERERVLAHPVMQWGEEGQSQGPKGFQPETERTVTAPFTLPSGGNKRLAQGRYGVPSISCMKRLSAKWPAARGSGGLPPAWQEPSPIVHPR